MPEIVYELEKQKMSGNPVSGTINEVPSLKSDVRAKFYANRVICEAPTDYHSHNFIEIAFVEDGEGMHQIGDETMPCRKGDIFLLNCSIKHRFIPSSDGSLTISNCVFLPEFFDYSLVGNKSFQTLSNIYLFRSFLVEDCQSYIKFSIPDGEFTKIRNLIIDIYTEFNTEATGYLELIRAYMIELLIYILRKTQRDMAVSSFSTFNKELNPVVNQKIISYIEEHFKKDVTIGDLAVMSFLSPAQFCRIFKKTTGFTVKEFMQKTRIEVACKMLRETNKPIGEISIDVGYNDIKYFTKLFTRTIGTTPSAFRKEIIKM
jgi:AraC family L-rhamnose operon transcriptional activator RhaR